MYNPGSTIKLRLEILDDPLVLQHDRPVVADTAGDLERQPGHLSKFPGCETREEESLK